MTSYMAVALSKPTLTVNEAADVLGMGRSTLYGLIARDEAPFPVIKLGAGPRPSIRIPTAPVRNLLGIAAGTTVQA